MSFNPIFGLLPVGPPHPKCRLTVTIPAKDEAAFIRPTLDALRRQRTPTGEPLDPRRYEVIVLANNCADATADLVRSYTREYPRFQLHVAERTLPPRQARVGTARRLLLDTAAHRQLVMGHDGALICTTDADTLVAPTWAYHLLDSARRGARAIGGRILVPAGPDRAGYRKQHLQDVTYRSLLFCLESMIDPQAADPWPRHFQHFGPSTALTVEAYVVCGGIPPLRCLEDVGLVRALERADIPVTHNPHVRVRTSARISHRVVAEKNFSRQLDEWTTLENQGGTQLVMGLDACRRLFKWKVALRRAYVNRNRPGSELAGLDGASEVLGWTKTEFRRQLRQSETFGALYQRLRESMEVLPRYVNTPIHVAIRDLRRFTHSARHRNADIGLNDNVPAGRRAVA